MLVPFRINYPTFIICNTYFGREYCASKEGAKTCTNQLIVKETAVSLLIVEKTVCQAIIVQTNY